MGYLEWLGERLDVTAYGGYFAAMANDVPQCPRQGCSGQLHREFLTGLPQSTSQMLRLGGWALIVAPILFGAPFFIDYVVRRIAGSGAMIGTLAGLIVPIVVGVMLLRYRKQRMRERTEQQRCNKCGAVFPVNG
jgi:hypothetical protein